MEFQGLNLRESLNKRLQKLDLGGYNARERRKEHKKIRDYFEELNSDLELDALINGEYSLARDKHPHNFEIPKIIFLKSRSSLLPSGFENGVNHLAYTRGSQSPPGIYVNMFNPDSYTQLDLDRASRYVTTLESVSKTDLTLEDIKSDFELALGSFLREH